MSEVIEERVIRVYVTPKELRNIADRLEKEMKEHIIDQASLMGRYAHQ